VGGVFIIIFSLSVWAHQTRRNVGDERVATSLFAGLQTGVENVRTLCSY